MNFAINNLNENQKIRKNGKNGTNINISYELKKEFFRKTIHMLASFVPYFYYLYQNLVNVILLIISLLYLISEILRAKEIHIPVIYQITKIAARSRDEGRIILGPITMVLGIFLSLTFFNYRIAVISIFALSFGDGVASLFGKIIGGWKIPFTFGKTFSGTGGCFFVLSVVYISCGLNISQAVILALAASVIEAFPTGDYDNLLVSVLTGFIAYKIL
jgi:phytol kinase